jgi:hypothetical protein
VIEEAIEGAEEEVSAAAGGIDHRRRVEAELAHAALEGAIEDERLDEARRLEERESLADLFVERLVEIAEKSSVARAEAELRGVGVWGAEEIEERARDLERRGDAPEEIVSRIEEIARGLEVGQLAKRGEQVVALGEVRRTVFVLPIPAGPSRQTSASRAKSESSRASGMSRRPKSDVGSTTKPSKSDCNSVPCTTQRRSQPYSSFGCRWRRALIVGPVLVAAIGRDAPSTPAPPARSTLTAPTAAPTAATPESRARD